MKINKMKRKRKTKDKDRFANLKRLSENLRPDKLFYEIFSKVVDILASLMKKANGSSSISKKEKSKNLFLDLKKDIIGTSPLIFSTIVGMVGRTLGWKRFFLIPFEFFVIFLIATAICVKISYEFGFDPKEKKEKKFILDLVLKILTSKEIIKEKSKIYLNLNPKSIFILDNLRINQKIIRSIYEEIEKTYKERLEKI
jgi:hypothetical protein